MTRWRRPAGLALALALVGTTAAATGAPAPVPPGAFTVVALGDSVPAGEACGCTPFPDLVAADLAAARGRPPHVVDLAEGGTLAADALAAATSARSDLATADLVLVTTGANDLAPSITTPTDRADVERTLDAVQADVDALLRALPPGPPGRRVVLTGYWAVGLDGAAARSGYTAAQQRTARRLTTALDTRLRAVARSRRVTYLDLRPVFHGPSGRGDPTPLLADDGDHPDAAGHRAVATAVEAVLGR